MVINKGSLAFRPGDIVCTRGDNIFSKSIRGVEEIWAKDGEADFNHVLVIIDSDGTTFEALGKIRRQNIYDAYKGCRVKVFRNETMTDAVFKIGFNAIKRHEGNIYPAWRLLLAMIPPLSRVIGTGENLVCSELVSKFLYKCGMDNFYPYLGKTPDDVHDMCENYKGWSCIFDIVI